MVPRILKNICPGIRKYPEEVRFVTKNLRMPFERIMLFMAYSRHIPNNIKQQRDSIAFNCCKACKELLHSINKLSLKSRSTTTALIIP